MLVAAQLGDLVPSAATSRPELAPVSRPVGIVEIIGPRIQELRGTLWEVAYVALFPDSDEFRCGSEVALPGKPESSLLSRNSSGLRPTCAEVRLRSHRYFGFRGF